MGISLLKDHKQSSSKCPSCSFIVRWLLSVTIAQREGVGGGEREKRDVWIALDV